VCSLVTLSFCRASKRHAEAMAPKLSRVLVDDRDERMATAICQAAALPEGHGEAMEYVVAVVGLVHLDGILARISGERDARVLASSADLSSVLSCQNDLK
jgi:pheromone shutdown protein TraB